MAKPYCEVDGCKKQFTHYHCPRAGCTFSEEFLRHARQHGGEPDDDGGPPWFPDAEHGPHPEILVTLPQRCKWVALVDRRRDKRDKPLFRPIPCDGPEGHAPHGLRKDGHGCVAWPKNARAFLLGPEGTPVAPPLPSEVPPGFVRANKKKCPDCDEEFTDGEPLETEPKYECSGCGNEFLRSDSYNDGAQCPDCYKFSGKLTDDAHVGCGGNLEDAEEITVLKCERCDEEFDEDSLEEAVEHSKTHETEASSK